MNHKATMYQAPIERLVRCKCCERWVEDVRFDTCFDCASAGEARAAKRTVFQHLAKGLLNLKCGNFEYAKYDFSWAWQRLTRTGDYSFGGTFDLEGYNWRS